MDEFGNYYLQSPKADLSNGSWRSFNIRPLRDIKVIIWYEVDDKGEECFKAKVDNAEWDGLQTFLQIPRNWAV